MGGMTPKELEGWARRLGETAVRMLAERDACPPTALVVVQGVPISTEMVLAGEEDKVLLRAYFEMAARGGAEACALVVEAWRARISTAAPWGGPWKSAAGRAVSPFRTAAIIFRRCVMAARGFVAVVGARELPQAWAPQVAEVVRFFLARGWGVGSGGARGADQFALEAIVSE